MLLQALWNLREFHDRFLNLPLVLPHFTVDVHCIACLLRKIFNAWDNEKDYGVTTFPSDVRTAFRDILNERNLFVQVCSFNILFVTASVILIGASPKQYAVHDFLGANC
jgi:hypothetical protein